MTTITTSLAKTICHFRPIARIRIFGRRAVWTFPFIGLMPLCVQAQVTVNDPLTGASSSYGWSVIGGACLTAGDGSPSTIPACNGNPYYAGSTNIGGVSGRLPDPIGQGALRLTNGGSNAINQTGAVVSAVPFPTDRGVKVTFTTVTYGGDGYNVTYTTARANDGHSYERNGQVIQHERTGADGMSFFLTDGTRPPSIGSTGGSLGYTCANVDTRNSFDGVVGGYIGLGIDEFGNFSNPFDNTADGPGVNPGTIALRGAGSVNFADLHALRPNYYPLNLTNAQRILAVRKTCATAFLQDWSRADSTTDFNTNLSTREKVKDYELLVDPKPINAQIYSQQNVDMPLRSLATVLTYDLTITKDNVLSMAYRINGGALTPVISERSITAGNGPLPPSFRFGFAGITGFGSNVHEISCFKAATLDTASNSAASNLQQSSKVEAGSQVYLSFYHPTNSWGQLSAFNLLTDTTGAVTIGNLANWDANCVLTGGACSATGSATTAQAPGSRRIYSWDGTKGVPFQYANLAASEKQALGGGIYGLSRIAYLRGDRSNELNTAGFGTFRKRDGILGDILNSSPAWVGFPDLPYKTAGRDGLTNTAIAEFGTSYANFKQANLTRPNIVYTGANDGMLHGFRAGAYDASGAFSTTSSANDGKEVLAFMPRQVATTIHSETTEQVDFSSPYYAHNSFVDATPGTGDLYYGGAWHTWLVGGLGPGGNPSGVIADATGTAMGDLYALDVTDPTRFGDATNVVIGEWNSNNLVCVNNETCRDSLGNIYGTPIIRLLHDGNWAVIFGNGRNSATGTAGVFIMTVDKVTGAQTFRFLNTGAASQANKNGIDYVASADLDGDHVTDYLYAGDSSGNVWRFDLTSASPNAWRPDARPVFTTIGNRPISTRITVNSSLPQRGSPRVLLAFGTGRSTPQTLDSSNRYASGTQSLYGIWDSNMQSWNARSVVQYAALATPPTISAANLQVQTITNSTGVGTASAPTFRTVSRNPVCWKGSTTCANGNTAMGWTMALPTTGEEVLYNPVAQYGAFIVNTAVPADSQPLSCSTNSASGFTMAIALDTGGALTTSLFNTVASQAGMANVASVAGIGLSATGTPLFVTAGKRTFMVQQTVTGKGNSTEINPAPSGIGKRVTWAKLR